MKGAQSVRVASRRSVFEFVVRRNITIVKGDSGTGKTTLFELIASHTRLGEASGVAISCPKPCIALVDIDWKNQLASTRGSIVFIDEGSTFVSSKEFASAIQKTDNYYVLFTREALHELPYSIDEIYRVKTSGKKYHTFERLYKSNKRHVYGVPPRNGSRPTYSTLLCEDSKAGLQFYESRLKETGVSCETSGNNASIYKRLIDNHDGRIFVVADGAAFGPQAERVLTLQGLYPRNITICLPESFEWLILRSGLIEEPDLEDVLGDTSAHVESREYFSWEQFYVAYLKRATKDTPFKYTKGRLGKAYRVPKNAERIIAEIALGNIR